MIYDEIAMNNGVIFQHTYDILYDRMNQGVQNVLLGNGGKSKLDASLFVPVVVTAAFACELLMKSMLPKNTRGHELDNLFAKLDDDIQKRIRNITIEKMREDDSPYCVTDFQTDLVQNNNIFAEWRYFHEGKSNTVNLKFISRFMKGIFEIVDEERIK